MYTHNYCTFAQQIESGRSRIFCTQAYSLILILILQMIRSNDRSFITQSQMINSPTRLFSECAHDALSRRPLFSRDSIKMIHTHQSCAFSRHEERSSADNRDLCATCFLVIPYLVSDYNLCPDTFSSSQ